MQKLKSLNILTINIAKRQEFIRYLMPESSEINVGHEGVKGYKTSLCWQML